MKLSYKLLLFAFVLVLTTSSCQTKQHAINQLESLSNDLRDNSEFYKISDWKKAAYQFQKIRKDISKHDYTPAQRKQIGELEGKCAGYFAAGVKNNITNGIMSIGNEVRGVIEGILKSLSDSGISF
jgi:hypothetical protein